MSKKLSKKSVSVQVTNKNDVMNVVKEALSSNGFTVIDCRTVPYKVDGATKFTLFARGDKADCKISFISKVEKADSTPFYEVVDEILESEQ